MQEADRAGEHHQRGPQGPRVVVRAGQNIVAEFSNLPAAPSLLDVSPIGRTAVDDFLGGRTDAVYVAYTDFVNTLSQKAHVRPLLPLSLGRPKKRSRQSRRRH